MEFDSTVCFDVSNVIFDIKILLKKDDQYIINIKDYIYTLLIIKFAIYIIHVRLARILKFNSNHTNV